MSSYRKTHHQRTGLTRRLALAFLPSLLGLLLVAGALGGIAGLAGVYGWRPQLPVGLLTGEGADQALASRTALLLLVVAVGLLGVALVTLVALQFNRRIRRPLSHLTAVARAVAAGDLQRRAHLRRADEIGALSGALDALAGQLQDLTATLDDRVAERTQSLEGRAARLLTAAEVGLELAPILDLGALGQRAVDLVAERFGYAYAGLYLLDARGEHALLAAGSGEAGRALRARGHKVALGDVSAVGAACGQRRARVVRELPEPRAGERSGGEPFAAAGPLLPETRAQAALPLVAGDRLLGALDVQSSHPLDLGEEETAILGLVAGQVAAAVDTAQRFSHEAALLEAASPAYRASRRLAAALTFDEIVEAVLATVAETEAEGCVVGRLHAGPGGRAQAADIAGAWHGPGEAPLPAGVALPLGQLPLSPTRATTAWEVADALEAGLEPEVRAYAARLGGRSLVHVPLREGEAVAGFMTIWRRAPGTFAPGSLRSYETLAEQAAVALGRARLYQDAQRLAAHEHLVGEVTGRIRQTLDVDTVLRSAAQEMRQVLDLAEVELRITGEPPAQGEVAR